MKITIYLLAVVIFLSSNPTYAITESEKSRAVSEVEKVMASTQIKPEEFRTAERTNVTGREWLGLSKKDQMDYITTAMFNLSKNGATFSKSPDDYYKAVKERLKTNSDFYSANITDILASIVYEQEPSSDRVQ